MTAYQPNPDKLTAFEELGGNLPHMTDERRKALGEIGLAIESPLEVARERDRRHFAHKIGILDKVEPRSDEDTAALRKLMEDLRAKRLPSMVNDPDRIIEPAVTPEESAAKISVDAKASWDELEQDIEGRLKDGRLF